MIFFLHKALSYQGAVELPTWAGDDKRPTLLDQTPGPFILPAPAAVARCFRGKCE